MDYIDKNCEFCKIANKEKVPEIIYEDEKIISFFRYGLYKQWTSIDNTKGTLY